MVLTLDSHQLQTIVAHAECTYPEECCGLLLGTTNSTGKTVSDVKLVENTWDAALAGDTASRDKTHRYRIEPQTMLAAMREARDRSLSIIGIYHSHPNNPAVPSECDRQLAWQQYSYLIVSVRQGQAIDQQSWSLNDEHQFQSEELSIISKPVGSDVQPVGKQPRM